MQLKPQKMAFFLSCSAAALQLPQGQSKADPAKSPLVFPAARVQIQGVMQAIIRRCLV
jgi:hypothetical protein